LAPQASVTPERSLAEISESPERAADVAPTPAPRPVQKKVEAVPSRTQSPPRARPSPTQNRAAAPELSLEGGFAVQLLAVSDRSRAQSERFRVKQLGFPAYVVTETDDDLHRVRVGNYRERTAAVEARDRLRKQGFPSAWILDLNTAGQ
jgi:cell division septation protein DedD